MVSDLGLGRSLKPTWAAGRVRGRPPGESRTPGRGYRAPPGGGLLDGWPLLAPPPPVPPPPPDAGATLADDPYRPGHDRAAFAGPWALNVMSFGSITVTSNASPRPAVVAARYFWTETARL